MCNNDHMDKVVTAYINAIESSQRKDDILILVDLLARSTGEEPKMWGTSIISFGMYHYVHNSGREGDAPRIGLSNRKQAIVLYGLHIADDSHPNHQLISQLGTHKTGKGCLYITKLEDIDTDVLERMVRNSLEYDK